MLKQVVTWANLISSSIIKRPNIFNVPLNVKSFEASKPEYSRKKLRSIPLELKTNNISAPLVMFVKLITKTNRELYSEMKNIHV